MAPANAAESLVNQMACETEDPMPNHLESRWLTVFRPLASPRLRLICLPYAGAGASAYRRWPEVAPPGVEIVAVQLPGREDRIREPPPTEIEELVPPLIGALKPLLDT